MSDLFWHGLTWFGIGAVCGALVVIGMALMAASGRMSRMEERWETERTEVDT